MSDAPQPLSNRAASTIKRLQHRRNRTRAGLSVLTGWRSVESAVQGGAELAYVVATPDEWARPDLQQLLEPYPDVTRYSAEPDALNAVAPVATVQGVLATVRIPPLSADTVWTEARTALVLDGVQDPGNVGTLIRTAAWFGLDAVIAGPGTAGLFHPAVLRAGMGGHWDLTLARHDALPDAITEARRAGFTCYGADLAGTPVQYWHPVHPSLLVIGSEAHGLSPALLNALDEPVSISGADDRGATESLNAAVAAGIVMHRWSVGAS